MRKYVKYLVEKVKNKKYNIQNMSKLKFYFKFCWNNRETVRQKYKMANHHILPKSKFLFPEHKNDTWNIVLLTHKNHYIAHSILAEATLNFYMLYAWIRMNGDYKTKIRHGENKIPQEIIGAEKYQILKEQYCKQMSIKEKGKNLSKEAVEKMKATKNRVESNGLSNATNSSRKAMITMKSRLWDGLPYEEYQRKLNTGRKLTDEQKEKCKQSHLKIEENGKTIYQNSAVKALKTRDAKIINGMSYREYCSQKLKENNPMKNEDVIKTVKKTLHTPKYEYNGKIYNPIEYRSIKQIIKGKWYVIKNVFDSSVNLILPTIYIDKILLRNLRFTTKQTYIGYSKNYGKIRLKKRNLEWLYGCYSEQVAYEQIKHLVSVEDFLNL